MRRLVFVLVAVVALAGVVAYMASASGQADGEAAPQRSTSHDHDLRIQMGSGVCPRSSARSARALGAV